MFCSWIHVPGVLVPSVLVLVSSIQVLGVAGKGVAGSGPGGFKPTRQRRPLRGLQLSRLLRVVAGYFKVFFGKVCAWRLRIYF
jgi:hypothetical protein